MENLSNLRKKQHLREVLLSHFFAKRTAAESHRLLVELYGEHAVSNTQCKEWFARFRSGDFDIRDKERPGQPKKFEDEKLEELLDQDSCQTQEELAQALNVTQQAISKRLKALGFIQKQGHWVPHELKPRDVERRFCMSEMLIARHKKKSFLHRIVTGDEKWIYYDNPKRKKSYCKRGQSTKSTPKQNIHVAKVMLCIWWDQKGVLYYELLKPNETINGERYRQQLIKLNAAIKQKRPEWEARHESLIFHDDNARPHRAQGPKNYVENVGWEKLPHPPYSPDLAPSDYHLFRSMQNALTGIRFTSSQGIKNWLDSFLASKDEQFFWRGIHKLPERWEKVVANDGQYFE
jgi:[histone H3]-lysine36 N-dimethyltransferase SETMAR